MKIATLILSGTKIKIGYLAESDPAENSVWFETDEQAEATYMTRQEARLLIVALETAIAEAQ